jgi:DNA polymerase-4
MKRYSEKSKEVMTIIKNFAPGFLQVSIDEAFLDLTGMERIYPLAGKAARQLKEQIYLETGLTVSIGVASSRFVAKLASDFNKPNGLTIVPPAREIEFVDRVGLKKLWGIGKATYEMLSRKGLTSTEKIRAYSLPELQSMLGESTGKYLYSTCRGIDPGIYQGEAKSHSISTETTFYNDVYGYDALDEYLLSMSHELMFKAFDEKMVPRTVGIKLRYGDFSTTTIQETPEEPIYSSSDVYEISKKLLRKKYSAALPKKKSASAPERPYAATRQEL